MSIIEVAKAAGVSKTTVSRVINGDKAVQAKTVARVRDAMENIGYKIPLIRRGPKRSDNGAKLHGTVAVVVLGYNFSQIYEENSGLADVLHGIETMLSQQHLKMLISPIEKVTQNTPLDLSPNGIDGLIILEKGSCIPPNVDILLKQIPTVKINVGWKSKRANCDQVALDNPLVGEIAADYLHSTGHQNVAYLSPYPDHSIHRERMEAFLKRSNELGMEVQCIVSSKNEITTPHPTIENTCDLVRRLLHLENRPTGAFISYVIRTVHAYAALRADGLEPMKDIDIVTAGNIEYHMEQMSPKPVVIDSNLKLVGEKAVEQLLWRLKHPDEKGQIRIIIEPILIRREAIQTI